MPSDAFISAAKAGNREPVVLMAIELVDAVRREVASPVDWQASKTLTDVDITTLPGQVTIADTTITFNPTGGLSAPYGTRIKSVVGDLRMVYSGAGGTIPATYIVSCQIKDQFGTVKDTGAITFYYAGLLGDILVPGSNFVFHNEPLFLAGDTISISTLTQINNAAGGWDQYLVDFMTPTWDTTSVVMT